MRIWKNAVSGLVLLVGGIWASLALVLAGTGTEGPHVARGLVAVALVALAVAAWRRRSRRWSVAVMLLGCLSVYGWVRTFQPSNSRDWAPDLVRAPWAEVAGTQVTLHDVRDFRYRSTTDWDPAWYTATYDTAALTDASFIVEPFSGFYGAAHTMVSFGFQDGRHVVFSVEVRREQGETFSALGGLFRRFEITYVVGDERDLVQLRSNFRHDDVYVYPVNASKERITAFFMDMVQRMNGLHTQPEFYDTLTSNCTTNLVHHFEKVATKNVPYDHRTLMPAFSDALAYELGIIDTDAPLEQVRQRYHINARALAAQGRDDFSARIRAPLETAAAPAP
ncbi:DUF4105 domain-containing protein [Corallococcus sp. AB004]|uniref:Lnb N-terminal periplasmic domain-containing protein n=1 Tax=Corallococcus sp. AB038B TaxID=2316718 RepID=UPI000EA3351D|nr:DUF4105 domain-containing protein [Corallococcus sp. AB038B]RKH99305.1 DUF4105 domain-containing protein [Corallococcus sp. AB038B]RKI33489.1 DUF4105 domain-containing protein [Corallococcus sp. AB004]